MRQQIRELHEKLIFANETIAMMEEGLNNKKPTTKSEEEVDQADLEGASDGEDEEASAKKVGQMIRKVQM